MTVGFFSFFYVFSKRERKAEPQFQTLQSPFESEPRKSSHLSTQATQRRTRSAPGTKRLSLISVVTMSHGNNRDVRLQCVPGTEVLLMDDGTTRTTSQRVSDSHHLAVNTTLPLRQCSIESSRSLWRSRTESQ